MGVSPFAARTWRSSPRTPANARILLIVAAVEAGAIPGDISTSADLAATRDRSGLPTLVALAAQLGVSRQTLNSWGRTCRVPAWVPLACAGLTAQPEPPPARHPASRADVP